MLAKLRYGMHAFWCTRRNSWKDLDKVEATSWIRRWVGEEAFEALWRRLFDYKFYDYASELSGAWIWSRIRRIGRSRYDLFREKLGYLEGGSGCLLQAMVDAIQSRAGVIRLNSPVEKVRIESGSITGIESCGQFESFDQVISTVPLPLVPDLIPDLPDYIRAQFASLKNVAVVCVIAKLNKPVTDNFWLNTNDPQMDIPGLVEYTNLRPLNSHIVYVPFYMPGEHSKYSDSDDVFADKVRVYLRKINPSLSAADILDIHVSRYRYAQPVCGPGYLSQIPPASLPIRGLWVADTSHYYPEDRGISESIGFGRKLAREAMA